MTSLHPLRMWLTENSCTTQRLADQAGVSRPMVSQVAAGKQRGGIGFWQKVAPIVGSDVMVRALIADRPVDPVNGHGSSIPSEPRQHPKPEVDG